MHLCVMAVQVNADAFCEVLFKVKRTDLFSFMGVQLHHTVREFQSVG